MLTINGEKVQANDICLLDYLMSNDYDTQKLAVEINCDIVPKSAYADTYLRDGDTVEIVCFVGGG